MRWLKILLQLLRLRLYSPRAWERVRSRPQYVVQEAGDTGGGWYRPTHRKQDPSVDPAEPKNESSSVGNDHGWSNCTMASGAMALDFHTLGSLRKWGGDLRHKQGDLEGGTDLYDLRDAWAALGETLTIRSGKGWDALVEDRADGRFLVVQGEGNVPGAETFGGGHACVVGPENGTSGNNTWLFGDPLASGWQWVEAGAIKSWMERWNSGMSYAITAAHPPSKPPEPEPEPEPEPKPPEPIWLPGISNAMGWQPVPTSRSLWDISAWSLEAAWHIAPGVWPLVGWVNPPVPIWNERQWEGTW